MLSPYTREQEHVKLVEFDHSKDSNLLKEMRIKSSYPAKKTVHSVRITQIKNIFSALLDLTLIPMTQ